MFGAEKFEDAKDGFNWHEGAPGEKAKGKIGTLRTRDDFQLTAFKDESGGLKWSTNCHGYTFADGKYSIDDTTIQEYLAKSTVIEPVIVPSEIKVGDIVVYREGGNVVHSGRVTGVVEGMPQITMAAGVQTYGESKIRTVPANEGWHRPAKIEYWRSKP